MFTLVIATYHLISYDIKYNYVTGICWFPVSLNGQHFLLTKMQVHAKGSPTRHANDLNLTNNK